MAYPANLRGWGPGWPTNRIADQVWVTAQRSGVRFQVHREIAPIIKFVIDEIERRGYWLHVKGDTPDDWSFNSRPIRGTNKPSNHSWGLAIDIDATKYPQGQRRNQPPGWVIDLFEKYGFEYGGRWSNPDPMHFEFKGSITEARHMVAMLAAGHIANVPAPMPPTAPSPTPLEDTDVTAYIRLNKPGHKMHGRIEAVGDFHRRHIGTPDELNLLRFFGAKIEDVDVKTFNNITANKMVVSGQGLRA